uniref:Uncharacterized protein n=1 Tax=Panagrolaimus superbus TaxID=310955 RepID=A0A914YWL4_9BILA
MNSSRPVGASSNIIINNDIQNRGAPESSLTCSVCIEEYSVNDGVSCFSRDNVPIHMFCATCVGTYANNEEAMVAYDGSGLVVWT